MFVIKESRTAPRIITMGKKLGARWMPGQTIIDVPKQHGVPSNSDVELKMQLSSEHTALVLVLAQDPNAKVEKGKSAVAIV